MSDDRAVGALELGMRRPLAIALAAFVISMGAFLVGLTLIVDSTTKVSFPAAVAVATPTASPSAAPVTFPAAMVGKTSTQASLLGRGGQAATQTPTDGEAGQVSVRIQKTAPAVPSRSTRPAPTTP